MDKSQFVCWRMNNISRFTVSQIWFKIIIKCFGCCNSPWRGPYLLHSYSILFRSNKQALQIFEVSCLKIKKNNITVHNFDLSLSLQMHQVFSTAMKEFNYLCLVEVTTCLALLSLRPVGSPSANS